MAEGGNSNFVSKLDLNASNVEAAWKRFKSQFSIFYIAKQLGEKSEEEQIANMLLLMGSDVVPIYERFQFATTGTDNRKTLENVKNKFDAHFRPAKSVIFERLKFNKTVQQPGQSIHAFVTQLLIQSDECEYGEMRDDLVRDRIVVGVHDDGLRDHLLTIENLNLDTCIRRAKQYASQREGVSNYLKGNSVVADNLDTVSIKKRGFSQQSSSKASASKKRCFYCNKEYHTRDRCPAQRATCHKCKKVGHWAKSMACGRGVAQRDQIPVQEIDDDVALEGLYLGSESD